MNKTKSPLLGLLGFILFVLAVSSALAGNFQVNAQEADDANFSADLSITKAVLTSAVVQGSYQYRIIATNKGPVSAVNVVIKDPIPENMSGYVSHIIGGTKGGCDKKENMITCNYETLTPGSSVIIDVNIFKIEGETRDVTSTSAVTSDTFDANLENNQTSTTVTAIVL
ncbi:MAG: hypothetical protein ACOX6V_00970 [Patescibacteria group bacterium]|jgi:uncharacterized repeat protein (TIGR01451 family)